MLIALQLFGFAHLVVLVTMLGVPLSMAWIARTAGGERTVQMFAWTLATVAIASRCVAYGVALASGELHPSGSLPMHLCDWAGVAAVVALIFRGQIAYELAYFWGLAGT